MKSKSTQPACTTVKTEEISGAATTTIGGGATLPRPQEEPTTATPTGAKATTTTTATPTGARTTVDRARTEATPTRPTIVSP